MKKSVVKNRKSDGEFKKPLNPSRPQERRELIRYAVERTIKEYGQAFKLLELE